MPTTDNADEPATGYLQRKSDISRCAEQFKLN
ncbi:hypothetical protein Bhyg_06884 [Pseudolycoriella hygida]|uniref:Uncharacterized protein n=1 Tax=Pseudolycoriella hygida TaxID=35572 RepID=A0A9Q0S2B9_9DIPT|nr:hypothetical protein Bhyg_06884 [Pseudolycoriella hygida]